jgi:hypothetical protein
VRANAIVQIGQNRPRHGFGRYVGQRGLHPLDLAPQHQRPG